MTEGATPPTLFERPSDEAVAALDHLFFIMERLDQTATESGPMVQVSRQFWLHEVRPAIQTVRARLNESEARP